MFLSFKKIFSIFTGTLLLIFLSQVASSSSFTKQSLLEIVFLDVGQGDATLINYLNRYQILIDGGPDGRKLMYELGKVMPKGDREIEIIISTHSDWDHFGGFIEVIDYYSVKSFLVGDPGIDKESFQKLTKKIKEKNININSPEVGSRIDIGEYLDIEFISPDNENYFNDGNDNSIVTRFDFGENSFLFTGDIGGKPEKYLAKEYGNLLDVDWLKVAHHGSKNSSSEIFLEKTSPDFSVISVGKNNYGHPAPETLERIKKVDSEILRTDELGSIFVECETPKRESCRFIGVD